MEKYVYSISALVGLVTVVIIMLRVASLPEKNQAVKFFEIHLHSSALYIIADILWGMAFLGGVSALAPFKETITYICLCLEMVFSFLWYEYCASHLYLLIQNKRHKLIIAEAIPALIGMQLVFLNISTNYFFWIDAEGNFVSGKYMWILWAFTAFYYVLTCCISVIYYKKDERNFEKARSLVIILVTCIFTLSTILQMIAQGFPFISLGLMLETLVVFVYNVTVENEKDIFMEHKRENAERNIMINALSDEYDIILWIDMTDNSFRSFSNTDLYKKLGMATEGKDFFAILEDQVKLSVYPEDVSYVIENLKKEAIQKSLTNQTQFSIIYRVVIGGALMYFETKLVKGSMDFSGNSVMIGIKNVDARERQELKRQKDIRDLEKKELEYRKALQSALENQNEIYAEMLHMQTSGVIVTDLQNKIMICNESASDIFDMPVNIMMEDIFPDVVADYLEEATDIITEKLEELKKNGGTITYEFDVHHLDGKTTFIRADAKLAKMSKQSSVIITSLTDITSNKEMEQKLITLSETDGLTGLLNRSSANKRTEQFIEKNVDGMFCLIDVNNFKSINDTYGHPVGDEVLVAIAKCLKKAFRRKDILMRMGGDEFGVFAADITSIAIGEKCITRLFEEIDKIQIEGADKLKVSVSLGAILCPGGQTEGYEEIYRLADSVMYTCKGFGENKYAFYT